MKPQSAHTHDVNIPVILHISHYAYHGPYLSSIYPLHMQEQSDLARLL